MLDKPPARAEHLLYASLFALTFVTGLIDAVSFLRLGHVFTANMTGNIVLMAFAVTDVPGLSLRRSAMALLFSLGGGVVAGHLATRMTWKKKKTWLSSALGIEALFLAVAAVIASMPDASHATLGIYAIISLTAFAMGVRNGTIRKLAVPDFTTTVLTLTVAGLAFDSSLAGGTNPRWQRRAGSIGAVFLGGVTGSLLLRHSLALVIGMGAAISSGCALIQLLRDETEHEINPNQG